MSKRLTLQCGNCPKTYFETLEITDQQEVIVRCPYCRTEAVANLRPYRKDKIVNVLKGEVKDNQNDEEFKFPDVFSTRKSE